jgi:hypothetical protein
MESETVNDTIDMLPEYCHYPDEGCALAHSCLKCPFPKCFHDLPRGRQRVLLKARDRKIARQHRGGRKTAELARKYGLSKRAVARILRNARNEGVKRGK